MSYEPEQRAARDEVRGARKAQEFWSAPARQYMSADMVMTIANEFSRRRRHDAVSRGFLFWSTIVANERKGEAHV